MLQLVLVSRAGLNPAAVSSCVLPPQAVSDTAAQMAKMMQISFFMLSFPP
jgi:hypothetical protein